MVSANDLKFRPIIHPQEKYVGITIVLLPMKTKWFLSISPNNVCLKKVHVDGIAR